MNMRALAGTDDLPRRTFTVKDDERMGEVGLIRDGERIDLIGGELVSMHFAPSEFALRLADLRIED